MTGPTIAADPAEIALCLSCEREDCDGGDPYCPWGRVYWQERDPEQRKAYMREYDRLYRRRQKQERIRQVENLTEKRDRV